MARLDKERQQELEPKRMQFAINQIESLGFDIIQKTKTSIQFVFKNEIVTFFPYSGWGSGKSIKDGRGINNLLKQISND